MGRCMVGIVKKIAEMCKMKTGKSMKRKIDDIFIKWGRHLLLLL